MTSKKQEKVGKVHKPGKQLTLSRFFNSSVKSKHSTDEEDEAICPSKRQKLSGPKGREVIERGIKRLQAYSVDSVLDNVDIPQNCDNSGNSPLQTERRNFIANLDKDVSTYANECTPCSAKEKNKCEIISTKQKRKGDSREYTPLEKQFMEIKKQNSDTVLFVECGYKYRFFGDDAEIAAKELNIFAHPINNFMSASIPTHRLQVHLQRLVNKGYKVGVVRQTETAALKAAGVNKSAPFTRSLDEVYTRATLFTSPLDLDRQEVTSGGAQSSSGFGGFILCLCEGDSSDGLTPSLQTSPLVNRGQRNSRSSEALIDIGVIGIQPSTRTVIYDLIKDTYVRVELRTVLEIINPSEIVISSATSKQTKSLLTSVTSKSENFVRIEETAASVTDNYLTVLRNFYSKYDDNTSNCDTSETGSEKSKESSNWDKIRQLPEVVQRTLALSISHLVPFKLENVLEDFDKMQKFSSTMSHMKLDGTVLKNLEIFKNTTNGAEDGSLFWFVNQTCTGFGRRRLRAWMAKPLLNPSAITRRLSKVNEIKESLSSPVWVRVHKAMQQLPDLEKGISFIQYLKASPQEFLKIMKAFETMSEELISHSNEAESFQTSDLKACFKQVPKETLRVVKEYLDMINPAAAMKGDKTNLFKDKERFPLLSSCLQQIEDTLDELQSHKTPLRKMLRCYDLEYVTVSGNAFLVEVKNSNMHIVPNDWIKVMSTKQVSRFRPPQVDQSYKRLCQLRETLTIESNKAWIDFLRSCANNLEKLHEAVQSFAELDCLISLAKVANHPGFTRPVIDDSCGKIKIKNGFHPVVRNLLSEQQQYVPNDTHLTEDGMRCMVITGPNMGGKSSYIKQVAVICLLAQMGSFVPADSVTLCPLDAIYVRMGASDDITSGRSTFMLELEEASSIIRTCTKKSLVILDELGRGTSTHDGTAIAYATLEHFISEVKCFTLFVTHYPLIGEFQQRFPDVVSNFHMGFVYTDHGKQLASIEMDSDHDNEISNDEFHVQNITFLYKLEKGLAARSYGLNVAKLANMPAEILVKAAKKAKELELETIRRRRFKLLMGYGNTEPTDSNFIREVIGLS